VDLAHSDTVQRLENLQESKVTRATWLSALGVDFMTGEFRMGFTKEDYDGIDVEQFDKLIGYSATFE
jgi:hypothetical protein